MSFVITDLDAMATAADDLQGIGSALAATNAAAAAPTTGVLPPATDSVSARAAALLDALPRSIRRSAPKRSCFTSSS
jgi:PE family